MKESKKPDIITEELQKGFQWSREHVRMLSIATVAFLAVGSIYSLVSYVTQRKERGLQEEYYKIERSYLDKKQKFEGAKNPPAKDQKEAVKLEASGDLQKDYGNEVTEFAKLTEKAPSSKAGQMAALNIAEIQLNYKKIDEALGTLKKLESNLSKNDLISGLVQNQIGNILAEKNDCKGAIEKWQSLLEDKKISFLHDEIKLRMGVCFEQTQDLAKAESLYKELAENKKDHMSTISTTAQKYLRLLEVKKQ